MAGPEAVREVWVRDGETGLQVEAHVAWDVDDNAGDVLQEHVAYTTAGVSRTSPVSF